MGLNMDVSGICLITIFIFLIYNIFIIEVTPMNTKHVYFPDDPTKQDMLEALILYYRSFNDHGGLCKQCYWLIDNCCENKDCGKYEVAKIIERATGQSIDTILREME